MTSAELDPPRLRSERARRGTLRTVLVLYSLVAALQVALLVSAALDGERPRTTQLLQGAVWLAFLVVLIVQHRSIDAWRRVDVGGEQRRWGVLAARVLPTGGAGYEGTFVLTEDRLRFVPGTVARLRGLHEESWPITALTAVRVTPVDGRRRLRGGRWVSIEVDGGDAITILTPEPHLVADELFDALHAEGLLPRPAA